MDNFSIFLLVVDRPSVLTGGDDGEGEGEVWWGFFPDVCLS
jgi:hypothetical protein